MDNRLSHRRLQGLLEHIIAAEPSAGTALDSIALSIPPPGPPLP
jgi:hypothetical protein